jgi:polysaccharide deacetylase 2 family uncharacterized protein YibQ
MGSSSKTALIAFWGVIIGAAVIGIGTLQYLGPPKPLPPTRPMAIQQPPASIQHEAAVAVHATHAGLAPAHTASVAPAAAAVLKAPVPAVPSSPAAPEKTAMGTGSALAAGAPIAAPNPALLAPAVSNPNWQVPRIAPNGLTPMRAYAAAVPTANGPHVAVLVAGLGDDDAQSQEAITMLPAPVSFGVTPYGAHITDTAALARASGHEIILEIPMQGANPAIENAGNEALVMAGPITLDQPMLDWNLAQIQGYAGVTDAIGATQGAGFMNNPNAKAWLLQELADRGLFFIDTRQTGTAPYAWNRTSDVVIDPVGAPQNESAQLTSLTALAKLQGSALGVLMLPTPNAIQMLQNWTQTLAAQGVTLVPVSALVLPPTAQAGAVSDAVSP